MSKYSQVDKARTIKKLILWGRPDSQEKVNGKQASDRFRDWCEIGFSPAQVAQVANGELDIPDCFFEAIITDANAFAQLEYKSEQ